MKYIPKQERERLKEEERKRKESEKIEREKNNEKVMKRFKEEKKELERIQKEIEDHKEKEKNDKNLQALKNYYLGIKPEKKKVIRPTEKFSRVFKFDWDESDDTSEDLNPLITKKAEVHLAFGKGYLAGEDRKYQRQKNTYNQQLIKLRKRMETINKDDKEFIEATKNQIKQIEERIANQKKVEETQDKPWNEKSLEEMTQRDWRIFREDYDIEIERGRAENPIRYWDESNIDRRILKAIHELRYKEPTPIQRQSIPIGLMKKDIIGIAETGSGKTAAYVIPLLSYIMNISPSFRERTSLDGPLAVILAPTRELAEQILENVHELSKYCKISCV